MLGDEHTSDSSHSTRFLEARIVELEKALKSARETARSSSENQDASPLLDSMLSSIAGCSLQIDPGGLIIAANAQAASFLKIELGKIVGMTIQELLPDAAAEMRGCMTGPDQAPASSVFEAYLSSLDCWAEFYNVSMPDRTYLYFRDITLRKKAEDSLSYQAQILQNVNDAIIATDKEERITLWNKAAENMLGWPASEVLGRPLNQVIHFEMEELVKPGALKALAETGDFRLKSALHTSTGRLISVEAVTIALRDPAGKIGGYVSVYHDITFRQRNEDLLRKSEESSRQLAAELQVSLDKLNAVIHSMVEAVIIADPLGRILTMNPAALELYGLDDQDEGLHTVRQLGQIIDSAYPDGTPIYPADWPVVRAAQGDEITAFEITAVRRSDRKVWNGLYNATPVRNREGEIILIVATIFDVTAQRRQSQHNLFLAQHTGRLLRLASSDEIIQNTLRMTALHLGADRCLFEEISVSSPGLFNLFPAAIQTELKSGQTLVFHHLENDSRLAEQKHAFSDQGIDALIALPILKDGLLAAVLAVISSKPREWQNDELQLLRALADQTWLALERIRLRLDLEQAQERFNLVIKNSPISIFTTDTELRYTWAYNTRYGLTPENMIGKTDADLFPPAEAARIEAIKRAALESGKGIRQEVNLNIDGQSLIYDFTIEPVRDPNTREIVGLTAVAVDITLPRRMLDENRRSAAQIEAQRLILQYREQERVKIAQDLHDGPLQDVMGLNFGLAEALRVTEKEQRMGMLTSVRNSLQEVAHELRAFCSDLRPPALAPFGLEKAILSHLQNYQSTHPDIHCQTELMPDGQQLPEYERLALFRIYQELMNNITRHSGATQISVRLTIDEAQTELEVQDNGRGFTPPENWLELAHQGHFGVIGMRERAEALGGRLLIRSKPGEGTLVRIILPRSNTDNQNDDPYKKVGEK